MTPDQLLGLRSYARAKTLSPEITIETGDAIPTVIANGTGESVPITTEQMLVEPARGSEPAIAHAPVLALDEILAELDAQAVARTEPSPMGAFIGFALFGAWTLVEIAMLLAH